MFKKTSAFLFLIATMVALTGTASAQGVSVDFDWDHEPIRLDAGKTGKTKIYLRVPDGFFLYADKTDLDFVTLEGIVVKDVIYPKRTLKRDPMGGKPVEIYNSGDSAIEVVWEAPADFGDGIYNVSALLYYQACSEKLCLKPSEKNIEWTINVGGVRPEDYQEEGEGIREGFSEWIDIFKGKASETILSVQLKWLILIAFIGGILSSFTPCILPLVPVTLLIVGVNPKKGLKSNFILSLLLVLGMSLTYAALGIAAAALGIGFGFIFQSRLFLIAVVVFLFAMALSLLGIYTFQLPAPLRNGLSRLGGKGYRGAFLAGISVGLLATPCVGPVLGALLVYAGSSKSFLVSFVILMIYSIGLGLVIILAGTWYGTVVGRLKKARVKWAKKFLGILVLLPALYYLNTLVPVTLLIFNRAEHPINWRPARYALTEISKNSSKPKMIFFTADWCPPCKLMKFFSLKDAEVVRLSNEFEPILVDATMSTRENQLLINRYRIQGWPTIVFTSPSGEILDGMTISYGYVSSKELVKEMKKVLLKLNP